jgi:hypothetical protein
MLFLLGKPTPPFFISEECGHVSSSDIGLLNTLFARILTAHSKAGLLDYGFRNICMAYEFLSRIHEGNSGIYF